VLLSQIPFDPNLKLLFPLIFIFLRAGQNDPGNSQIVSWLVLFQIQMLPCWQLPLYECLAYRLESSHRLAIVKVNRIEHETSIANLAYRVTEFHELLLDKLAALKVKPGKMIQV